MDWKTCFKGKKILLVEDDEVNQQLMKDILQNMNCEMDLAVNGNQAIEKSSGTYDLILMDVRLPEKDGLQATKEIRAKGIKTPIFGLTASVTDTKSSLMGAGMNEVLQKPIDLDELRSKMAQVLLGGAS